MVRTVIVWPLPQVSKDGEKNGDDYKDKECKSLVNVLKHLKVNYV